MDRSKKLKLLSNSPSLLKELLDEIPHSMLKLRRIKGKWSIHEHACHLAEAHQMMMERFKKFKTEKNPVFVPYLPDSLDIAEDYLLKMDIDACLEQFISDRKKMVDYLQTFEEADWKNNAQHPEYRIYNADIFLRHIVMHDHLHMYRIEELWLTTDEYLNK